METTVLQNKDGATEAYFREGTELGGFMLTKLGAEAIWRFVDNGVRIGAGSTCVLTINPSLLIYANTTVEPLHANVNPFLNQLHWGRLEMVVVDNGMVGDIGIFGTMLVESPHVVSEDLLLHVCCQHTPN